jgi:hypothetical protein
MLYQFKSVLAATIVIMTACGSEKNKESAQNNDHTGHDTMQMDNKVSGKEVKIKDDNLSAIYHQYALLTEALISENVINAKVASNAIEAGSKFLNDGTRIASAAAKITAAPDIESQRREYAHLSNALISLVKESGTNSGEVYVDFCPMAMNDKGAFWLSSTKNIRNPYYGDKMLTCGEVKDTIK